MPPKSISELLGGVTRFGLWTVAGEGVPIDRGSERAGVIRTAICRCDCGTVKTLRVQNLKTGRTTNCGCQISPGHTYRPVQHGHSNHPLYRIWKGMIARCHFPANHAYHWYGARGIAVCNLWRADFLAFVADMDDRPSPLHTLDRIDGGKGYEPGNVRWADKKEQAFNRVTTTPTEFQGNTYSFAEACGQAGVNPATGNARLRKGWPMERILTP